MFYNLNEIKNRTVLLPYIYRPLVYETVFSQQFSTEEFILLQAYLQAYGDFEVSNNFRINYAAFMGNSSSENIIGNNFGLAVANDSSKSKSFGGRLGAEIGSLSLGGSISYDKKKVSNLWEVGINLGYMPRIRLGAYLNFSIAGFELESEYIKVNTEMNEQQEAVVFSNPMILPTFTFDKEYVHVNLLYNIIDQVYAYGGYDYMYTMDNFFSMGELDQWTVGAGYRINYAVVIKAQYVNQKSKLFDMVPVTRQDYLIGASVYF